MLPLDEFLPMVGVSRAGWARIGCGRCRRRCGRRRRRCGWRRRRQGVRTRRRRDVRGVVWPVLPLDLNGRVCGIGASPLCENDVPLDADASFARPVDTIAFASSIVSDKAGLVPLWAQFLPPVNFDPNLATPLVQVPEIRLLARCGLERSHSLECAGSSSVPDPNTVADCLCP